MIFVVVNKKFEIERKIKPILKNYKLIQYSIIISIKAFNKLIRKHRHAVNSSYS